MKSKGFKDIKTSSKCGLRTRPQIRGREMSELEKMRLNQEKGRLQKEREVWAARLKTIDARLLEIDNLENSMIETASAKVKHSCRAVESQDSTQENSSGDFLIKY